MIDLDEPASEEQELVMLTTCCIHHTSILDDVRAASIRYADVRDPGTLGRGPCFRDDPLDAGSCTCPRAHFLTEEQALAMAVAASAELDGLLTHGETVLDALVKKRKGRWRATPCPASVTGTLRFRVDGVGPSNRTKDGLTPAARDAAPPGAWREGKGRLGQRG